MDQEQMMKAAPNQDSFLKESLLGEEEGDYTADEVERGSVEAHAQPLLDDQHPENLRPSGPLNPWRHSGLKMQSPHQDLTILLLTDDPQNLRGRNLGRGVLKVAERGLVDLDQHGPQGKINRPALGV